MQCWHSNALEEKVVRQIKPLCKDKVVELFKNIESVALIFLRMHLILTKCVPTLLFPYI